MHENDLTHASPEALGIPSQAILDFLSELRQLRLPIHSFLLLRHGKIAAEGYCPPFDETRGHRMYSVSKSFTSVAIGMLADEGKISLDDRVAGFFPEHLPENPPRFMMEATVRHFLCMASFNENPTYDFETPDFVQSVFSLPYPLHKPGTVFRYDTSATVALCGIVEKLTGKPMLAYMRPLFDKLGISRDIWCVQSPEGRSWTGSGIVCTPRDLARFGLFCLQRGSWNGEQLVSREYMEAATSRQIDTTVAHDGIGGPAGYGYQFWMMREGGFACWGMGGQFAFMMPKYDSVFVMTADTQAIGGAEDAVRLAYYRMLGKFAFSPLPEEPALQRELGERSRSLRLPLPVGSKTSPVSQRVSGVRYVFEENPAGFRWMQADISEDVCTLRYEKGEKEHMLKLYMGEYGPLSFPDKYFGKRIGVRDTHYRCVSAGAWADDGTLIGMIYAVDDYLGTLKMQLTFADEDLTVFMAKSAEAFFDDYSGYLSGHAVKG